MSEEKTTKKRRSRKAAEDAEAVVENAAVAEEIIAETDAEEVTAISETTPEVIEQVAEPVTELPPVEDEKAVQEAVEPAPAKKFKKTKAEPKSETKPEKKSDKSVAGSEIELKTDIHNPAKLYFRNDSRKFMRYIAGTAYVWGDVVNNRIPVATDKELVGKANGLIGWVDIADVKE